MQVPSPGTCELKLDIFAPNFPKVWIPLLITGGNQDKEKP